MELQNKINEFFESEGINYSRDDQKLSEYIVDSIQYIKFFIALESTFNIKISEEYLVPDDNIMISDIVALIEKEYLE